MGDNPKPVTHGSLQSGEKWFPFNPGLTFKIQDSGFKSRFSTLAIEADVARAEHC
jgi:hypothetical protein